MPSSALLALTLAAPLSLPVRVEITELADSTRGGRPVQVMIWSPASKGGPPATVRGLAVEPFDSGGRGGARAVEQLRARLAEAGPVTDAQLQSLLDVVVMASFGAPAASGPFPLVLLTGGLNSPAWLHFRRAELLAAAGYVVATPASVGLKPGEKLSFDASGLGVQVADELCALAHLEGWPRVRRDRVALVAWSVSGLTAAALATRRPEVRAVVSLDSGLSYGYGDDLLSAIDPSALSGMTTPLLQFLATRPARFKVPRSARFFDARKPGSWELTVADLSHPELTDALGAGAPQATDEDRQRIARAAVSVDRALRQFLDQHLKGGPPVNKAFLEALPGVSTVRESGR